MGITYKMNINRSNLKAILLSFFPRRSEKNTKDFLKANPASLARSVPSRKRKEKKRKGKKERKKEIKGRKRKERKRERRKERKG